MELLQLQSCLRAKLLRQRKFKKHATEILWKVPWHGEFCKNWIFFQNFSFKMKIHIFLIAWKCWNPIFRKVAIRTQCLGSSFSSEEFLRKLQLGSSITNNQTPKTNFHLNFEAGLFLLEMLKFPPPKKRFWNAFDLHNPEKMIGSLFTKSPNLWN